VRAAGFGDIAQVDTDLVEWDYGLFEGKLTRQILKERPGWEMFRDGCPEENRARRRRRPIAYHSVCAASRVTSWRFPVLTSSG